MNDAPLTQAVKELAKQGGAVLVGVAPIERFDRLPPFFDRPPAGHGPRDYLPSASSVVSIAMPVLSGESDRPAVMVDSEVEMIPPDLKFRYYEHLYVKLRNQLNDELNHIARALAQYLEGMGHATMHLPATGVRPAHPQGLSFDKAWSGPSKEWAQLYLTYESRPQPFTTIEFAPFSHRHAATRAGLGEFGYNNIVLTKQFGARQRFTSIITEAELAPDPLVTEPICLRDKCGRCLRVCPIEGTITLRDGVDKGRVFIDTPSVTDPRLCRASRNHIKYPKRCFYGDCYRICPIPKQTAYLSKRLRSVLEEAKRRDS